MTFEDWIFSRYPADNAFKGQWQLPHILTLVITIGLIVAIALIFRKKSEKARRIVIWVLVGLILFFEIARRVINLIKNPNPTADHLAWILLPRPLCAISCWSLIAATVFNKKYMYNFATIIALISSIIFFAYPEAGFNNKYILFEATYSIGSHVLLLLTSISLITLKFTDYRFKTMWKELICLGVILVYTAILILTGVEGDPMYFMPESGILGVIPMPYPVFLVVYIVFMMLYILSFYMINDRARIKDWFAKRKAKKIKN